MNLVLMGPPGAGKGTQGEILSKRLDINTISTGVMLRTAIKEQSEIGKMAEKYINDGKLVADEAIIERLSSRRECSKCGAPYNIISNKPETEGICDKCKGELIQRADDVPETIKNRLNVYHEQTEPIKAYYEKLGLLVTAKGEDKLEDTTSNVAKALGLEV